MTVSKDKWKNLLTLTSASQWRYLKTPGSIYFSLQMTVDVYEPMAAWYTLPRTLLMALDLFFSLYCLWADGSMTYLANNFAHGLALVFQFVVPSFCFLLSFLCHLQSLHKLSILHIEVLDKQVWLLVLFKLEMREGLINMGWMKMPFSKLSSNLCEKLAYFV